MGAACGGSEFTAASPDASGTRDGSGDIEVGAEAGSSGGSSGDSGSDAGGGDATSGPDAPGDASVSDAFVLPDVVEEPPAHCGGQFACVPGVPVGWEGPFEMYQGSNDPGSCSPNFLLSYQGNGQLQADAPTCGCSCGAATGVQCSSPPVSFYASTAALTPCTSANHCVDVVLSPGICTAESILTQCTSLLATNAAFTVGTSVASGGTCTPTPSVTVPSAKWGSQTRACISTVTPAQVDCTSGSVCAPLPAQPFDTSLCVAQTGDVQCPAGYTRRSVSYGGMQDGRHCTACTCGAVTGSTCASGNAAQNNNVVVSSSMDLTCSSGNVTYGLPTSCAPIAPGSEFRLTLKAAPGSCTPSQPAAAGAAAPSAPTTFCCQ